VNESFALILGLLIASIPILIIAILIVVVVGIFAALSSMKEIMETFLMPPRYWFLRLTYVVDWIILLPIWAVVFLLQINRDVVTQWSPLLIFTAVALTPTALSWVYCKWEDHRSGYNPSESKLINKHVISDSFTWELWFQEFKTSAGRANPKLKPNESGESPVDFMEQEPLKLAFRDGVDPDQLGKDFGAQWDSEKMTKTTLQRNE